MELIFISLVLVVIACFVIRLRRSAADDAGQDDPTLVEQAEVAAPIPEIPTVTDVVYPEIVVGPTPAPAPIPESYPEIVVGPTPAEPEPEFVVGPTPVPTPVEPEFVVGPTPAPAKVSANKTKPAKKATRKQQPTVITAIEPTPVVQPRKRKTKAKE
jgi:hypothetical protein